MDKLKPFSDHLNSVKSSPKVIPTVGSTMSPSSTIVTNTKTVKVMNVEENETIEEIEQQIICESETPNFSYKGIPIKGTVEEMKKAFQQIGKFENCSKHHAHLVGSLFGFPNVYIRFVECGSNGVNEIHFYIPIKNKLGGLKTIFTDFQKSLQSKYGSPKSDTNDKLVYIQDLGRIELHKLDDHIEVIYADSIEKYKKIEKLKAKLKRLKYLQKLQDDI